MKVLKFGGSSVGSVSSLLNVKKIVESYNEPMVVVVSAIGGVTDSLIQMATTASTGDDSYLVRLDEMKVYHEKVLEGLFAGPLSIAMEEQLSYERRLERIREELALQSDFNLMDGFQLFDYTKKGYVTKAECYDG